jgi:hypothetical protein
MNLVGQASLTGIQQSIYKLLRINRLAKARTMVSNLLCLEIGDCTKHKLTRSYRRMIRHILQLVHAAGDRLVYYPGTYREVWVGHRSGRYKYLWMLRPLG